MADISKLKVAGQSYDIKDKYSRDNAYVSCAVTWDGNTEGMESLVVGQQTYYKYSDALELKKGQILGAKCSAMRLMALFEGEEGLSEISLIDEMFKMYGVKFDPLSILDGCFGVTTSDSGLGQMFISLFLDQGMPEALVMELAELIDDGLVFSMNLLMFSNFLINAPKEYTLSPELSYVLFNSMEPASIPEGLWLLNEPLGNEAPIKGLSLYPDTIYSCSENYSEIVNSSLAIMQFLAVGEEVLVTVTNQSENAVQVVYGIDGFGVQPGLTGNGQIRSDWLVKITSPSNSYPLSLSILADGEAVSYWPIANGGYAFHVPSASSVEITIS